MTMLKLVGTVTLKTAGNEVEVEIFETIEYSNLAYAVREGFDGATIVEDDEQKVRVKRANGDVLLVTEAPDTFQLVPGDKCFIAKLHTNGR